MSRQIAAFIVVACWLTFLVYADGAPPAAAEGSKLPPNIARVVVTIKKLGGKVELNPDSTDVVSVDLSGSKAMDATLLQLKPLTALKSLDLSNTRITIGALRYVAVLTGLEEVRLAGTGINPQQAERQLLQKLPKLKVIWEQHPLSDSKVAELVKQVGGTVEFASAGTNSEPYLVEVNLPEEATDEMVLWVQGLTRLKTFRADSLKITNEAIKSIRNLKLEVLSLAGANIDDVGLSTLSEMTTLVNLQLSGAERITDRGVASLASLAKLSSIGLNLTQVNGMGLPKTWPLEEIEMTAITPAGAKHISEYPKLKYFHLYAAPTERVTADVLSAISESASPSFKEIKLCNLEMLRISLPELVAIKKKLPKVAILASDGETYKEFDGSAWVPHQR